MNKLQSAIQYAKKGFYVLPMHGKQPLIKFANNPPLDLNQIKYYWSKYPDANIALRTVDFFVVDIDTKEAHGANGMQSLKQLSQGVLTPTLAQRTASGGYQLFYRKPTGVEVKQVIGWKPGIDIKAHINNYVVVPPSTNNKGKYRWINAKAPIKEPSNQLVELINSYHPQQTHHINHRQHNYMAVKTWAGRVLDNLIAGAPQGQRNDYLTRVCGQLVRTGANAETVLHLLLYANQFNNPPLNNNEVKNIVVSILKRG